MTNHNVLNSVGSIICFLLFGVSMAFVAKMPLLTITGIIGLSGVYYFVYRLVSRRIRKSEK